MKKFNLEAAKSGAAVCTRNGKEARIICFDAKREETPIIALVLEENGAESLIHYKSNGRDPRSQYNDLGVDIYRKNDLMMKGVKREGWINIWGSETPGAIIFATKEKAIEDGDSGQGLVDTIHIEWEE